MLTKLAAIAGLVLLAGCAHDGSHGTPNAMVSSMYGNPGHSNGVPDHTNWASLTTLEQASKDPHYNAIPNPAQQN